MRKNSPIRPIIIVTILMLIVITSAYAAHKNWLQTHGTLALATWNVTLDQTGVNNTLVVVPGTSSATYTLNISSTSEVDVKYSIVISNLPTGVKVALDDGEPQPQDANHKISFTDVGVILYTDNVKTKSRTLTFTATQEATVVNSQPVTIDVIVNQIL